MLKTTDLVSAAHSSNTKTIFTHSERDTQNTNSTFTKNVSFSLTIICQIWWTNRTGSSWHFPRWKHAP